MRIYEVRISHGARVDMAELRKFLKAMMTVEGAIRYANNMRDEIKMVYSSKDFESLSLEKYGIHVK